MTDAGSGDGEIQQRRGSFIIKRTVIAVHQEANPSVDAAAAQAANANAVELAEAAERFTDGVQASARWAMDGERFYHDGPLSPVPLEIRRVNSSD
jgi:hypothetical protein